jgi:transcriptional regulator with AAA-type ATPase domain
VELTAESSHRKEQWIFEDKENHSSNDLIVEIHRYPVFDKNAQIIGVFGVGKEDVVATQLSKISLQTSLYTNQMA